MGKLKKLSYDKLLFEIRSARDDQLPPWITLSSFEFEADKRGAAVGQCILSAGMSKNEVVRALGELLLANSPRIQSWLRNNSAIE